MPEHDSKVAEAIGEKIHEVEDAAEQFVTDLHKDHPDGKLDEMIHEIEDAAEQFVTDLHKEHPEGKLDKLMHEIEDATETLLPKK